LAGSKATTKQQQQRKISVGPRFLQSDLSRALRALKAAGIPVGQIEIANGDHRITVKAQTIEGTDVQTAPSGYMTLPEACNYGRIGRTRLYELIQQGVVVAKKLGAKTLVSRASIDKLLKKLPRRKRKRK